MSVMTVLIQLIISDSYIYLKIIVNLFNFARHLHRKVKYIASLG